MPMVRAKAGILLLDAANQHQKPLKLGVVAIALPEIDEPTDNLKVARFVVPCAVYPIERWQKVLVGIRADELKWQACQCAAVVLKVEPRSDPILQLGRGHPQLLVLQDA